MSRGQPALPGMAEVKPMTLTEKEWEELAGAVAYAVSYWEEGAVSERASARAAERALHKIAGTKVAPAKYRTGTHRTS